MHLSRSPRLRFAHLPIPLEPLANLSGLLGAPRIWIKRDDRSGLGTGGKKTRKLEFLLDPVYTGKGMAGLIDLVRGRRFAAAQNIVFTHTGGSAGLFGFRDTVGHAGG